MKKFLKFVAAIASATVVVLGVLYVVKNFILKDDEFDFSDFDDDFDDDFDEALDLDDREYVTLNTEDEDSIDVALDSDATEDTEESEE